jgi:Fe-S-cluster containining protein
MLYNTMPPSPSSDQRIILSLKSAYARYKTQSDQWIKGFTQQGGRVFCQAGCANCCNFPIQISLAEGLYTASLLSQTQLAAMQSHAARVIKNAQVATDWDMYFWQHRTKVGFCPLLDQTTGNCTAYEARPARCRDTYSAFDSHYCKVGTLEQMTKQETRVFQQQIKANAATDGKSHYIAPLEDMGENIWQTASRAMQQEWGLEIWGDYWVLTSLANDLDFMNAIRAKEIKKAIARAKKLKLWHLEIVQIEEVNP